MITLRRILDFILGAVCCILLGSMVLVLAWQVFSRYALNDPSTFSEEFLRFGVIWMSLLGAAFSAGKSNHMAISLLRDMSRGRLKKTLSALVPVSFVIFSIAVLILGGIHLMGNAAGQYSPVLRVPQSLIYASLPVSGVFIVVYSVLNFFDILSAKSSDVEPTGTTAAAGG